MCLNTGGKRSPGEENATHSSVLAWELPWTGKPGRLQSMGSQKSHQEMPDQDSLLPETVTTETDLF